MTLPALMTPEDEYEFLSHLEALEEVAQQRD